MRRSLLRAVCTLILGVALGLSVLGAPAHAGGDPTPTPTCTETPTPTPPPEPSPSVTPPPATTTPPGTTTPPVTQTPAPTGPPTSDAPPQLPVTGPPIAAVTTGGVALAAVGVLLVWLTRRRDAEQ